MEVYMVQKTIELYNDACFSVDEELFFSKEDAIEYMQLMFENELRDLENIYCYEEETIEDYCEIDKYDDDRITIYMEEEIWIEFNVYKKVVMKMH